MFRGSGDAGPPKYLSGDVPPPDYIWDSVNMELPPMSHADMYATKPMSAAQMRQQQQNFYECKFFLIFFYFFIFLFFVFFCVHTTCCVLCVGLLGMERDQTGV